MEVWRTTLGLGEAGEGETGDGDTQLGDGGHLAPTLFGALGVGLGDDTFELLLLLDIDS